jgi:small-conductance mechanosensitive channel
MSPRRSILLAVLLFAATSSAWLPARGDETVSMTIVTDQPPADLYIANRRIVTLRAGLLGSPPAERAEATVQRVHSLIDMGGPLAVTIRVVPEGRALEIDKHLVFRILGADVDPEGGATLDQTANAAAAELRTALAEIREARDSRALLPGIGWSLLATVGLVGAFWLLRRAYVAIARRIRALVARRTSTMAPGWGGLWMGYGGATSVLTAPLRLAVWLVSLGLLYTWTGFVLTRFPYTRPWGESLRDNLLEALGSFGAKFLHAIPGLLFVALIFMVARLIVRLLRAFFLGIQQRRLEVGWVDETTARPTERLLTTVVWLFALVAAYPYLPGSGSEAFKGIGVFVGLMLSIGASGIVNQAVSGLMLMYTRALRPGEFVQIGEHEGIVKSVGFVTTRLETLRHEEINIPNSVIASTTTRNYSRLAGDGGVRVATKLTIGYDTPWRQVQAMLEIAASRCASLAPDPSPRVLQTALLDFYVEYTLLVTVADPARRMVALTELHGQIQDVFNEHGVQIMSPNYEADPAGPKIVPRERWYAPPAAPEDAAQPPPGNARDGERRP